MKTRIFVIVILAIGVFLGRAQADDYSSYLTNAEKRLAEGNCDAAQRNYAIYKELSGKTNSAMEQKLAKCGQPEIVKANNSAGYVDLGLPSGTQWKYQNETDLYTYNKAVKMFGCHLPTRSQFEELISSCTWTWALNGYWVTGPSGNSIFLPSEGYRPGNTTYILYKEQGYYWSSTPYLDGAWELHFTFSSKYMAHALDRKFKRSVRLVK